MNCNYKVKITDIQTKYKFKVFCTGYDDSEIKEKIDTMYEAWPKTSGEGETPMLDNTANATMSIDLKGNTSQETTTGKNLLSYGTQTFTTAYQQYDLSIPAGTYTFSAKITSNDTVSSQCRVYFYGEGNNGAITLNRNERTSGTITTTAETTRIVLYASLDYANSNGKTATYEDMQLEVGSSMTDYEPYTNGASPNPDYPQDIHVVSGDNTISIAGKNLLEPNSFAQKVIDSPYSSANVSTYDSQTGELSIKMGNRGVVFDNFKGNTQYTIILKYNIATNGSNLECWYTDNSYDNITPTAGSGTLRFVTRANKSVASIKHSAYDSTMPRTLYLKESGIFEGVIETTSYEPYQSQSYAVNLGTMELCKIGDYQDYIYKDNKKWYKYGAIGKVVLNGSENWGKSSSTANTIFYLSGTIPYKNGTTGSSTDLYCNYFDGKIVWGNNVVGCELYVVNSIRFGLTTSSTITTLEDWKTWLSTHNTIVYYILGKPTTTEITDTTLISQLNALAEAESYSGQTNISQTNDDKPFILTAKALKDLSNL